MIDTLERVVTDCGRLLLRLRDAGDFQVEDKEEQLGQHFSLKADRESLGLGRSILKGAFPGEVLIAEEQENPKIPLDCVVFDPQDGTANVFNGLDEFGVAIAVLRGGRPQCGATYFPVRDLLISAEQDKGCYVSRHGGVKRKHYIRWHGRLDKTQLGTDIGSWTHRSGWFDSVLRPLSERFNFLSAMAAIEGQRRVLFGHTGAYFNLGIAKIWDAAAMCLAIEEAGGVVCAPDGSPLIFNSIECNWVTAVNQELADIVLNETRNWRDARK